MKLLLILAGFIFLAYLASVPIQAEAPGKFMPTFRQERKELGKEIQEKFKEIKQEVKQKLSTFRSQIARIVGAEVTAISGSSFTVKKDENTYTVNTDENTHLRRHYWGGSDLAEFSVGNKVNILGKFVNEEKTSILAHMIRNLSIMKRHGVFLGDVKAKNSDNFVITSKSRGDQTVYFNSGTKFTARDSKATDYSNLQVGDRVRVRGLWDKTLSSITEVSEVKDYTYPPKLTKAVTPTTTLTPTSSP